MSGADWIVVIAVSVVTALIVWLAVGVKRLEAGVRKVLGYTDGDK
jgi:hypothetical protein